MAAVPTASEGAFNLPTYQELLAYAAGAWPEQPAKAGRVVTCEAAVGGAVNPKAFRTDQVYAGPMQIAREPWQSYFAKNYGWTWQQLAQDMSVHFQAARIIYDRAGGWSPWPVCQYN